MHIIQFLLWISAAGLVTCTGFLILVIVASSRFAERAKPATPTEGYPPVTILKPLCGLEPNLEANLESFFHQDYPCFEIIFGTRDLFDPALKFVERIRRKYPLIPIRIVTSGQPDRPNAKVCSLRSMQQAASYDYLVVSDSDVQVMPDYLRAVVRPLLREEVGLVTCLYRGVPSGGFWSKLEALGMSVEMTSGVLVADLLEGMKFALGPTMAFRRDVLEKLGGWDSLADYCADDFVLGERVSLSGSKVVLSEHVVRHIVINRSLRDSMLHQIRWMKSTRFSRPAGHVASLLSFAMPFGILGLLSALRLHHLFAGVALLLAAYLNRVVMAVASGWNAVRDHRALRACWLYPLRDLTGFLVWVASFFGSSIVWRGEQYQLHPGGRMVRLYAGNEPEVSSVQVGAGNAVMLDRVS